ncbi:response regulator transcription factor [Marinobacter lutaoensis]|jgi:DNA-binding response OmpR family regulator|uniref:response regulator n=1 Tax=Marinobacter lutaoensis TaxID=135739 RepID=UPI000C08EBD1|nr:response regulator transcription factor [Marinobacter lutaoensis]MBE02798.1 DNA-binding response regulator [Marinobacter sp.]MBI44304.1 DNA-binding response regulator [Oceanospirillales bacterium]NVD36728.1 response regulator transcription factor [Marinobacter lutaoensis]|tara:strand:+ start:54 stop:770 length:717 start_codon:yes stop_codon:yes gene_type:complete
MSDTQASILVVDDDAAIRELLREHLTRVGYTVLTAGDGADMHARLDTTQVDLIVLDVMLPGDDGFTLCRQIRAHSRVPIIMLTASSDETDRVVGLELGADDYLAKPFSARELQARIKALLRRARFAQSDNPRYLLFDRWRLDTLAHELIDEQGRVTPLSGADFALLQLFLQHPNRVLDRDTISEVTRGRESLPLDRVVDVAVSRLRQRLGDRGRSPKLIKTVRGAGYLLAATVRHASE